MFLFFHTHSENEPNNRWLAEFDYRICSSNASKNKFITEDA